MDRALGVGGLEGTLLFGSGEGAEARYELSD